MTYKVGETYKTRHTTILVTKISAYGVHYKYPHSAKEYVIHPQQLEWLGYK